MDESLQLPSEDEFLEQTQMAMGMEMVAFRRKYLTDAPFHALVTVHVNSLRGEWIDGATLASQAQTIRRLLAVVRGE